MERQNNINETEDQNDVLKPENNETTNEGFEQEDAGVQTDSRKIKKAKKQKAKKQDDEDEKVNPVKEVLSWLMVVVVAVVIAFVVNNFIIINANVPSGSMENTIMTGDRMIGLRTAYWFSEPERGDIVIFKNPDDESETFVKRLIGLPGEKVTIKDAKIYINDSEEPLEEDYLPEEWVRGNGSDTVLEYNVPEGCYFMLGDNRNISHDARYWTNTYVTRDQIIAKAVLVYWPWAHKGILESADYGE